MILTNKKRIFFEAFVIWLFYSVAGKVVTLIGASWRDDILAYLLVGLIAVSFGMIFLFIFDHERLFEFAYELEKKEEKAERKWFKRFRRVGSILTVIIIGILSGPLLSALAASWLIKKWYKYYLVAIASILGSWFWLAILRNSIFGFF